MGRSIRTLLACLMFAAWPYGTSFAQSLGTTFSDLWWNPAESGWGVTVDHQQDVMFLTFFIYRADGSPYWVTGALFRTGTNTIAPFTFAGDLNENHGPYFGGQFNSSLVGVRKVGTATFTASLNAATLTYSIDGVTVTKSLQRQTLRNLDFSGLYNGTLAYTQSNCPLSSDNNRTGGVTGQMTILQSGGTFELSLQSSNGEACAFVGPYQQTGSIGSVSGRLQCSNGTVGTFMLDGLQWTLFGMSARFKAQQQGDCSLTGLLGGTGVH